MERTAPSAPRTQTAGTAPLRMVGRIWSGLEMATGGVLAGGVRSLLTILGVAVAVASVVSLLGVGEGAKVAVAAQFEGLGTNIITVESNTPFAPIHASLAPELVKRVPGIAAAVPVVGVQKTVTWRTTSSGSSPTVLGVTPALAAVHPLHVKLGSFLSTLEQTDALHVAVVGSTAAQSLFGAVNPLGQDLYIGRTRFRVIGVLSAGQGSVLGGGGVPAVGTTSSSTSTSSPKTSSSSQTVAIGSGLSDAVLIPQSTAELLTGSREVSAIWLKATNHASVNPAVLQIQRVLALQFDLARSSGGSGGHHGPGGPPGGGPHGALLLPGHPGGGQQAVTVQSLNALVRRASAADRTLSLMLAAIAAVSLVVGGIGVMNIMLVAVRERTVEIGLRKALGALQVEIVYQFLLEAVLLCALGGLVGWLGGYAGMRLLHDAGVAAVPLPGALPLALAASTAVALIFGSYPAYLASELEPVEALRRP